MKDDAGCHLMFFIFCLCADFQKCSRILWKPDEHGFRLEANEAREEEEVSHMPFGALADIN